MLSSYSYHKTYEHMNPKFQIHTEHMGYIDGNRIYFLMLNYELSRISFLTIWEVEVITIGFKIFNA